MSNWFWIFIFFVIGYGCGSDDGERQGFRRGYEKGVTVTRESDRQEGKLWVEKELQKKNQKLLHGKEPINGMEIRTPAGRGPQAGQV